ncbi:MAG: hypothetical protein HDR26_00665 [Lachnospiraceae bacterium]|nr:hypothetical protein [Lachnospiraceae bacterium]
MKIRRFAASAVVLFCLLGAWGCGMEGTPEDGAWENSGAAESSMPQEDGLAAWPDVSRDVRQGDDPGVWPEEPSPDYEAYFKELAQCYSFRLLPDEEKYWYVDIYHIFREHLETGDLWAEGIKAVDTERIYPIFQCVLNDHPEIFYVSGYHYTQYTQGEETVRIAFSGVYDMDAIETAVRQAQIALYVEECLSGIPREASEYEKVKYVYDYLIEHTQYNLQAEQNQNICSVFIGGESVCQGYAKATQYLLQQLGMEATLVMGTVNNGEGHAWNLVRIDGEYYYVDTTWGDASYQITENGELVNAEIFPSVNYDYLCVTTQQLCRTHVIDNVVPVPECTSMAANYYVMEGAYFTEYDETELEELFRRCYEQGREEVTLKCADYEIYRAVFEKLITNQQIFRYLDAPDGVVAYADDEDQLLLTFWLT